MQAVRSNGLALVVLLALLCTVSVLSQNPGCGTWNRSPDDQNAIDAQVVLLNQYRATWTAQNIQNYEYSYTERWSNRANEGYPWNTIVGYPPTSAKAVDTKNQYQNGKTVEDIFALIQYSLQPTAAGGAGKVKVDYNALGFPNTVTIDWDTNNANTARCWQQITMTGFANRNAYGSPATQYTNNLNLWNSQRIVNYRYQLTYYGMDNPGQVYPVTITVSNGIVTTATQGNNLPVTWPAPTLDIMLSYVVGRGIQANSYVSVAYAPEGYPVNTFAIVSTGNYVQSYKIDGFTRL